MNSAVFRRTGIIAVAFALAVFLSGCGDDSSGKAKGKKAHLVEAVTVAADTLALKQIRTGTLRARREVKIYVQEEGKVELLPYYEGDQVKKDDVLIQLDKKLLTAEYQKAKANLLQAEKDAARFRKLSKKKLVSREQLLDAETRLKTAQADVTVLNTRLGYATIQAPFDGLISARLTEPGNVVQRYDHVLTISDPASLVTELAVSELILPHLKTGDPANVRIDALGDETFTGSIIRIHPEINPVTRRGTVEVELSPVPAKAQPGQLCRVTLFSHEAKRLVIPFSALRRDEAGEYVFIIVDKDDEKKAKRVGVKSGLRFGEKIEILQGLESGQLVISKGFLGLRPGKTVKIASANNPRQDTTNDQ